MFKRLVVAFLACFVVVPAYAQDKPIVGIAEMTDLAQTGQTDTFVAMLETAIVSSGKFNIIERSQLATLMKEQGLASKGVVRTKRPGQTGGFEAVDYLVYGSITSVSAENRSSITSMFEGMLQPSNGNEPCRKTRVRMEVDIKITDTSTGQIKYADRISQIQDSATFCGPGTQVDRSELFRSSADAIATGLVTAIYPIQLAAAQNDGSFILNFGKGAVEVEDFLMFYGESSTIPDPSGNGTITIDGAEIGAIQVIDVQNSFSRAVQVTNFCSTPPIGAIARPTDKKVVKGMQKADRKKERC